MSNFIDAALAYAARGWRVIPLHSPVPGGCSCGKPKCGKSTGKHSRIMNWVQDASTDENTIRGWWHKWPDANIGICTGPESGIFVVDSDLTETEDGEITLASHEKQYEKLPDTPTQKTGSGGMQRFFSYPHGVQIHNDTRMRLGSGLDVRGVGGLVVVPPSMHRLGTRYTWIDEEINGADPKGAPDWLLRMVCVPTVKSASPPSASNPISEGSRNQTLARFAGTMRRAGASREVIDAAIQRLNLDQCKPPLDPSEVANIATSIARYEPDQVTQALVEGWWEQMTAPDSEGATAAHDPEAGIYDPGIFPSDLRNVPGLVSQMVEYANVTSHRTQPTLALAACLAAFSAIIGRTVEGHTGSRTNLYILGIGESAGGKNAGRSAIKLMFELADSGHYIGADDVTSETAILRSLANDPSQVFMFDEFGRMLRAINAKRADAYLARIVDIALKLYSEARSIYRKKFSESKFDIVINQPNLCIYGTSVKDNLWSSLDAESVTGGLIGRMLLFPAETAVPERQLPSLAPPDQRIVDELKWWATQGRGGGNLRSTNPATRTIAASPDALSRFDLFNQFCDTQMTSLRGSPLRVLWGRSYENATKLALVYACSANHAFPQVDLAAAHWACRLSEWSTRRMIFECHLNVAESQVDADHKFALNIARDAGSDGIPVWLMNRKLSKRLDRRRAKDVLETLQQSLLLRMYPTSRAGAMKWVHVAHVCHGGGAMKNGA